MRKLISSLFITILSLSVGAQGNWKPGDYNGISIEEKSVIFYEEFDNNRNDWWLKNQGTQTGKIADGTYFITSQKKTKSLFNRIDIPDGTDFEIEIILRLKKLKSSPVQSAGGIIWGRHSFEKNQFSFGYNLAKKITISRRSSASSYKFYKKNQISQSIDLSGTNKLTVRKVGDRYFLFINEILEHSFMVEPSFGNGVGFAVSNAKLEVEYFKVLELSEAGNFKHLTLNNQNEMPSNAPIGEIVTLPFGSIGEQGNTQVASKDRTATDLSDVDVDIPVVGTDLSYRYALIIGNEDYSSFQTSLSSEVNVDFAKRDAEIFKEYSNKVLRIPESNIILEINSGSIAMQRAIKKVRLIIKNTGGKAEVFFYYAGHGLPDEKTKEAYLIPVDIGGTDLEFAIKLKEVYNQLTEFDSKRVTVFLDACFSGGARNQGLLATRGVKIKPKDEELGGNLIVFSASSGDESSLAYEAKGHGIFSYFLFKKLKESSGYISYKQLSEYLKDNVSLQSVLINSREQVPQTTVSPAAYAEWENWRFN